VSVPTLPGIEARRVLTRRLGTRVLFAGPEDGVPVLFFHGNFSSATWWEETLLALPPAYRGIAPDLRGFGGADSEAKVDARRGMGDFVDDALALMYELGYDRFHLAGVSLGGLMAWWMLADCPGRLRSVTLAAPGSPYGFGGTRDEVGTPIYDDFSGSGGGLLNRELIRLVGEGERSADYPFAPRSVLRLLVWGPDFIPPREDALVDATLQIHLGDQDLPGDHVASPNWPYFAPGRWGATNAMSARYAGDVVARILRATLKPGVLWVYGTEDVAVSNTAASDPGTRGMRGLLEGWPGAEAYPPQPMMRQIRRTLEDYARAGGHYDEVAIEGAGHVPFLSHPEAFSQAFHAHLQRSDEESA